MVLLGLLVAGLGGGVYALGTFGSTEVPLSRITDRLLASTVARTPTPDSFDGLIASAPRARKQHDTGWVLPSPHVITPRRSDLTLEQIAVTLPPPQEAPQQVRSFARNAGCTLRRPQKGEVLRNVRLYEPARYTHTHAFWNAELAEAVVDRIEGLTRDPNHYKNGAIADGRMGLVDVFVTDTSAPVYLVLQSFNRDVIWNLHLAPGVTLRHVAMIGNKSGFAAPPGSYTHEALRIGDFIDDDTVNDNETIRPCMVAPFRKPQGDWPLLAKVTDPRDGSHYRDMLRLMSQGHRAFDAWYSATLGQPADVNLTSAISTAHALSGPEPAAPIPLEPVESRLLHLMATDHVAFGNDQLLALHDGLLLAATGGDLSILHPAPMEVSPQ